MKHDIGLSYKFLYHSKKFEEIEEKHVLCTQTFTDITTLLTVLELNFAYDFEISH